MPTIADITATMTRFAPLALQEDYDNCGMQVGDSRAECTGVLLAVDVTPETVAEASMKGCNLIVTHHPLIFKGLKSLTGKTRVERTVLDAIKAGIAIFSLHTAIDNAPGGISHEMGRRLGLHSMSTLAPMEHMLMKLSTFIPHEHVEKVCDALYAAGAGKLGSYDRCSFAVKGEGSFRPLEGANPFVGTPGREHYEGETRVEMLVPSWLMGRVEQSLIEAHPYEMPAYDFTRLENSARDLGSGVVGSLPSPMEPTELIAKVKEAFTSPTVRCNALPQGPVKRVALCGGAGAFLIRDAIAAGADAFITSDTRYHDFVDYTGRILIIDIGHFEGEQCSKDIFYRVITEKFPTFAVYYSLTETNPILYL